MNPLFILKQYAKSAVQNILLPVIYYFSSSKGTDRDLIVFADARHESLPDSMKVLHDMLSADISGGGTKKIETFFYDFGKMSAWQQLKVSAGFMKLYARAGCVVLCDNFLPVSSCKKKSETRVIQLWHGPGAFKKFGYDAKSDIPKYYKGHVYKNYDLVTVSGQRAVAPFTSAMRLQDGIVRAVGVSRLDVYFDEKNLEISRALFEEFFPGAAGRKVLLWVPTFRGNAGIPELKGLEDVEVLRSKLGDEWVVLISLHPHLLVHDRYAGYKLPMTSTDLLVSADVVMTDYSSILYDAAVLKKRLLIFAPDLKEYLSDRGTYMDISEIPAQIVEDGSKLEEAVRDTFDSYDFDRQRAFYQSWLSACDGHATERILRLMM